MYENIGGKIKIVAVIFAVISALGCIIAGCVLMEDSTAIGLLLLFGGPLLSWVGSFFMYGFGELVENSTIIAEKIGSDSHPASYHDSTPTVRKDVSSGNSNAHSASSGVAKKPGIYNADVDNGEYCACGNCQRCQKESDCLVWCEYIENGAKKLYICPDCRQELHAQPVQAK